MNLKSHLFPVLHAATLAAIFLAASPARAATLWIGPLATFNEPGHNTTQATNQDRLTASVWLTRASSGGPFNAVTETTAGALSPADTEWAIGTLDNYSHLSFSNWLAMLNGQSPVTLVGQPLVVHLISDDIYLSVNITFWGARSTGGFTWQRSTPADATATSLNIPNLAGGAVFAAPANVTISANTPAGGGLVTNLVFLTNSAQLASLQTPPFTITASNLASGGYAFTAVSTAAGLSITSTPLSITVVTAAAVTNTLPAFNAGQFTFSYNANPGLGYVVQSSSNLVDWLPLATNVAASTPVVFIDSSPIGAMHAYRVGRVPNP